LIPTAPSPSPTRRGETGSLLPPLQHGEGSWEGEVFPVLLLERLSLRISRRSVQMRSHSGCDGQ
jgi:hypothetical protein